MKKFLVPFLLSLGLVLGLVGEAQASYNQDDITNFNNAQPPAKNARDHGWKTGVAKCVFDPSADTSERTIAAHACDLAFPAKVIVTGVWYKVLTTFTSATDAATIAIKIVGANDVVSAVAISNGGNPWDAGTPVEGIPKIETTSTWLTTTAASTAVTFTVAVEALTAGKMVVWVQYLYYGDV